MRMRMRIRCDADCSSWPAGPQTPQETGRRAANLIERRRPRAELQVIPVTGGNAVSVHTARN